MIPTPHPIPMIPARPILTHNDLDGLLSWLFLRQWEVPLVGLYDLQTIYLTTGVSLDEVLAIDLDLSHPKIPSIGHHFTLFQHPHQINMNRMVGLDLPQFRSKCPVPTVLILHWMTQTPLPASPTQRAWLAYADGLHESYARYTKNVTAWLRMMGFEDLLADLQSGRLAPFIEAIRVQLAALGWRGTTKRPYPQCRFRPAQFQALQPLIDLLTTEMGYPTVPSLPSWTPVLQGSRYSLQFTPLTSHLIEQKFQQHDLLSHGLIYHNHLEVTLLTPLSPEKDKELWHLQRYATTS